MCGIAGIWNRDGRPAERRRLALMGDALLHRGPDARGLLAEGSLGMSHCRLSILDLSALADQPMTSDDGRYSLSFNGEIHNFVEIRKELQQLGHSFRSTGDSEVVLEAFRRWGPACFSRFNGMWALAVWDREKEELVLSRDRFGLKPLYYATRGPRLAFASEIKGILAAFPEDAEPDESELGAYLLGANPDSGATSFYRHILAVPPATFLTVTRNRVGAPQVYWNFQPSSVAIREDPVETFRELLVDSVRIRLRSDTPVGVCVSGGLDSSSVAVLARELTDQPIHCFSLQFRDHPEIDESHYAAEVLRTSDQFITHWVRPEPFHLLDTMESIVRAHDAPAPLRGRLGMWEIFREAHRTVKVVLIGEGGDELLAGYRRFLVPYATDLLRLGPGDGNRSSSTWSQLRRLRSHLCPFRPETLLEVLRPFLRYFCLYSRADESALCKDFLSSIRLPEAARFFHAFLRKDVPHPSPSLLNNALWQEFRYCGIPELLHAEDSLAMAFSLETRAPFLDHRLVEFCFRLPHFEKIHDGWTKHILRRAMRGRLPEKVRLRRQKVGLPTPYRSYFQNPTTLRRLEEMLLEGRAVKQGILRPAALKGHIDRLQRDEHSHRFPLSALWRYVCVEIWLGRLAAYRS